MPGTCHMAQGHVDPLRSNQSPKIPSGMDSAALGFWSSTPLIVGLVVVVICVLYSYFKRWLTQPIRAPEPPELQWYRSGLPGLGPAIAFRNAPNELLLKAQKQMGDVFGLDLVAKQLVFVMGPEAHR
jgi:hypothetical protein